MRDRVVDNVRSWTSILGVPATEIIAQGRYRGEIRHTGIEYISFVVLADVLSHCETVEMVSVRGKPPF